MKHLLTEKFNDLNIILERFFKLNYNRSSTPLILQNEDREVFNLACKIYKRGFIYSVMPAAQAGIQPTNVEPFLDASLRRHDTNTFFLVDENFIKYHPIINNYFSYLPSESTKNLSTVKNILTHIPENTKSIFIMGGGITLDIGGFIAGLLNLPVHYLPTTLLSAVDAAVGGKTGVNFSPYGKNQIGLFYESSSLYFAPEFLNTLSQEEKLCGVVEAAKHSYLFGEFSQDKPILEKIISNSITNEELTHIVNKNFQYKSRVVQLDPHEKNGIRANLNFGHTLAHVLEALTEETYIEKIPHGIAVAHGIKFLFDFHFVTPKNDFQEFINRISSTHPIVLKKEIKPDVINCLLLQDKKNNSQEKCRLSLPRYGCFAEKANKNYVISELSQKIGAYLDTGHNFCLRIGS